jgi:hypothetical protein
MPKLRLVLFFSMLVGFLSLFDLYGQVITGNVRDEKTGRPMPFANVFVNNTTIGAVTDNKGNYRISADLPPNLELAVSFVGYVTEFRKISLQGRQQITVNFEMEPKEEGLSEVMLKSKRDKRWERYMRRFERVFLAVPDDPFFSKIEIKNPWVIDFEQGRLPGTGKYLAASASQPIQIENRALGYQIEYHLQEFIEMSGGFHYFGLANFKTMDESSDSTRWEDARNSAYFGSVKHFLSSLLRKRAEDEGFKLYEVSLPPMGRMRTNRFEEELGMTIHPILEHSIQFEELPGGIYRVQWPSKVEVHFTRKFWINDYYNKIFHAISWLEAPLGYFDVDGAGVLLDPQQLVRSGNMGRERVARFVPFDFMPQEIENPLLAEVTLETIEELKWTNLMERPHLSLNKSVFHSGEMLWFQTQMLYQNILFADTLSKTLYVDLVNDRLETLKSGVFFVENGTTHGQFLLEEDFPEGKYALVAYTNWMENYRGESKTVKYFTVAPENKKPVATNQNEEADEDLDLGLTIEPNGRIFKNESGVTWGKFTVFFKDAADQPLRTNFTISLLDAQLTSFVPDQDVDQATKWIYGEFDPEVDTLQPNKIEYGISLEGNFSPARGKIKAVPLTIVVGELEDFGIINSDSSGYFFTTAMHFYDSTEVAIAALDEKQRRKGSVELIRNRRTFYKFDFDTTPFILEEKPISAVWKDFLPDSDIIELDEVQVADQRITSMEKNNYGYGKGDKTIGQDFLQRFPQMKVADIVEMNFSGGIMMRQNWGLETGGPLVMVDGMLLSEEQGREQLEILIASEVESIEVYTYAAAVFGTRAAGGVISITTKKGSSTTPKSPYEFNKTEFQLFKLLGFSKPLDFPEIENSGNAIPPRPTLYWNPSASTGEEDGKFEFEIPLSDLTNRVLMKIEGINGDGLPFRKVFEINLSSR